MSIRHIAKLSWTRERKSVNWKLFRLITQQDSILNIIIKLMLFSIRIVMREIINCVAIFLQNIRLVTEHLKNLNMDARAYRGFRNNSNNCLVNTNIEINCTYLKCTMHKKRRIKSC